MKKVIWKIVVLLCLISFSLYGVQWNDLKDGESAEKNLDGNGKVTTVNKLKLGKNSHLKVKGKNTKGIVIKGGLSAEVNIGEGATLDVDIENSTKDEAGISLESTFKGFIIQKNGNLKLKKQFNGTINSGDIFKQFLDRKGEGTLLRGISVIKTFSTEGSTRIESAGTGIGFDRKTPQGKGFIEFKKGSKTFVKAGFAGVFARYNSVTFEEGSDTTLIGGAYGIMVNKGTIKKGAKVTLMGNYGTGKFEVKEHDFLKFESGSELNILANDSALYGIRLKGKTKLIAKGYNVLRQIDTYADGEHSLDTVTFERGSILDGNIDRSWNSQILLEEGTKLFVPNKIQANLEIKGDLYVGPRSAYEGKQLTYKEAVEDADTVAGATAIFMGKQAQRARKGEFSYRGLYNEFSPDEYYTLEYNRDNHYNYISTLNLNNGKIHLRLGNKDKFGRINDKIIFSKNTIINGKGELVFHKRNSSQVTKNTVFNILEEEGPKDINGIQGYYLEKLPLKIPDVSFGKLVFTTKVQKLNGKYVVSLVFKGIEAENFLLAKGKTKTLNKKEESSLEDAILSAKEVTLEENSTLNIKGDTNGLFAKNKVTIEEEANLNIETKKDNKIGLKLGENLETFGNINIKNTGTGILADNATSILQFENGSKTIVNAKDVAVNAQKGTSEFKGGSNVELTSNKYALVSKKAVFEKSSTVKLNGEYGIGTLSETDSSDITFKPQSEVNINSSNSGIYNVNVGGSGKVSIKAPNILKQVRTVNQSLKFESGSVLEGNIEKSWNANLILDKGSKMFVNNKIEANMDIKGDLFVGTSKFYEKRDSFDNYNTIYYNKDSNGHETKVNFDNSKIHLRIGGADKTGATNDKIFFSKNTNINGKGELVFHKRNSSQVTKNTIFKILEEEVKNINGTQGYYLEKFPLSFTNDIAFGQLVFTTKVQKLNGKYIVSLVFKGIEADNFLLAKGETKTLNKKKEGSLEDAILSAKEVTIEEKSTLNIKGDTNGLFAKNKVTIEEEANLNIETENKIALKLGENLETFGNINIKNAGIGILADNTTSVLQFENGSKTIVNAKDVAINAQKGTSEFKGGSNVELTSNKYALVSKKAVFEKSSTVKLNGEYGIGTLSETDSSDITFKPQSEVNINSSNSGIYNVNVGGSGKVSIKAPNILKQVRTVNQSLKFESGSVLEGNIEKSWNANLILDKGSKMFVNNKIEANMDIKGDLFVGTRNSYEKEESKNSMQTLSTMSTFSSSDKYNTVHYNKDSNGHKTKVNLDNANIHLRINGEQSESNDKIVFSKDTEITGKGEITLHPENVSKVKRNMTYSLLEEEGKDVGGNKVYNLEKTSLTLKTVEFGPLVYGRKDKKVNGKYMVTLEDTGELSQAAKNSLTNSRDSYKYNQEELKAISDKIFENHNLELKNNFWLLVSKENLKNKDSVIKLNQNTKYAGYDYTFNTGVSLGFFAGQSTGRYKNIGQGIYLKKDLKPFYLGTVYKHTKSKDKNNDKKLHSNDFSFVVGYNKDISEKTFLDSNIKLTRGYISDYKYTAENDLSTKNEKTDYWNGEIDAKLGYKFKYGNAFLKAGLDKDLKGNQKVIWNENIDEEIKYDDLSKNIGIGMEYKIKQHSFNIELSRKYSKHYRANTKISIGYSYKF